MVQKSRAAILSFLLLGAALWAHPAAAQCVSLTTAGSAVTQSFNTLSSTAERTTKNLTLTGWFMTGAGLGARDNDQYAVDTGGSNTGDTYSYGAAGNSERALGSLQSGTLIPIFGACFTNNTGSTLSSLDVAYTGEQWRLGTTARTDQINFEYSLNATSLDTGNWTGVAALNFVSPDTGTVGAKDGNGASNRTARSATIPALSIANGATFWIRWNDANASGADDGLAVDDFSLTPQGGGGPALPTLNIGDVTLAEGDPPGTTTFTFPVTLTAPAGPGGVTFDIATTDNTATTADNDYVTQSLTGQTIPMGSTGPYNFSVTVNRDTATEANETFFVNVTSITGANAGDVQGLGTINNDDVSVTPIHDIQGPGGSSPIVGASVTTRGIVTGVKNNGYFLQEPDASVDADPATSEGIFVFTSSAPPASAALGNYVQVTATVVEFVPAADLLQPPLTELSSPTTVQLSTGNPLPAAIPLTATFPDPAGPFDQLERLEAMRVSVASLTVSGPTLGNSTNEPNATQTSNGVFFGVVTGVLRPFREPGIQAPDPAPSGSIPPIPRFDANPEMLRVDSDGLTGGTLLDVGTGAVVTGLVGPLDYGFRHYTVLPDPGSSPGAAGGPTATSASVPADNEITVAAYNLERFFDNVNDPNIGEPVLTAGAFGNRLNKASIAIRDHLRLPDILGVVEVENLSTLQALAARINAETPAPNPEYVAYLVEGNDVGGIDVGFLVKTGDVIGGLPRVIVNEVVQENADELFVNPDSSTSLLNDRPSLRLDAVVNDDSGASFPVTVIVNHLRSLNDVNSIEPGSNGWATDGDRVRAKRQKQAESLANLVQTRQTADPSERIILIGDFNAFEFNDGFADLMNVITGTPPPDNETAVPGDGIDLVNPDLDNLVDTPPPAERYSYIFDGQAQNIDHVVVNGALTAATSARRIEHPRINADFPAVDRNDPSTPRRLSDHDPVVAFFQVTAFGSADLVMSKTDGTDPVAAGLNLVYTITLTNNGPDDATGITWNDTLPAGTTFVSLVGPVDWTCSTPAFGAGGTVSCSAAILANTAAASFDLTVAVNSSLAGGTVLTNTAQVTALDQADPTPGDSVATATTTVVSSSAYRATMTDTPDPVVTGQNVNYFITVTNSGPSALANVSLLAPVPTGTTFQSFDALSEWTCSTPAVGVGAGGMVSCFIASLPPTFAPFRLTVRVTAPGGTELVSKAFLTSDSTDTSPEDNEPDEATTVLSPAAVTATKTASGEAFPGGTVTYTVVLTNNAATAQGNNSGDEFTDVLPAELTLVSASATSGTAVATVATNTVTWNGSIAAGASVTITIQATVENVPVGTTITNQGTVFFDADGNGTNEASGGTDDPAIGGAANPTSFVVTAEAVIEVPVLDHLGLLLLVMMLAGAGALLARRF